MDGFKYLILANRDNQQNHIYINDGNLNFPNKISFATGNDNTRSLEVTDINQDGIKDIITQENTMLRYCKILTTFKKLNYHFEKYASFITCFFIIFLFKRK